MIQNKGYCFPYSVSYYKPLNTLNMNIINNKKKILFSLLLLFSLSMVKAQTILETQIHPENPSYMDSIEIVNLLVFQVKAPLGLCPELVHYETSLYNSILNLDLFYDISGGWILTPCYRYDTVNIGTYESGIYALTITTHKIIYGEPTFNFDSKTISLNVLNDIEDDSLSNSLSIYPIPAKNKLFINTRENVIVSHLTIFNMQGKIVRNFDPKQKQLNIEGISSGFYILNIIIGKKSLFKKVIIQ